jgi:hypothetical protein
VSIVCVPKNGGVFAALAQRKSKGVATCSPFPSLTATNQQVRDLTQVHLAKLTKASSNVN